MADIFDVISDPTRRDLLARLLAASAGGGELSVGTLVEQTGLSQPTVSKHLRVLRDQGLVAVREEAQHRYYRLDPAPLGEIAGWLAPFSPTTAAASTPDAVELFKWSGAAAGEQLGRAAATSLHQATKVLHALQQATADAREQLVDVAKRATGRAA
jgi:DNA-binding transcriptional ArsR family regulator